MRTPYVEDLWLAKSKKLPRRNFVAANSSCLDSWRLDYDGMGKAMVLTSSDDPPRVARDSYTQSARRLVRVGDRQVRLRLEPGVWDALIEICQREEQSLEQVCLIVDRARCRGAGLASALRLFAMAYFRDAATEEGHASAGHGEGLLQNAPRWAIRSYRDVVMGEMDPDKQAQPLPSFV